MPISNDVYVEPPVTITNVQVVEQLEAGLSFGMEFPQLFNPPPVGDRRLISDPVTSGGDSTTGRDNDQNEDDQNGQ